MKDIPVSRLAWLLALVASISAIAAFLMGVYFVLPAGDSIVLILAQLLGLVMTIAYAILGALVAARQPRNPIGWIFLAVGWLNALEGIFAVYEAYGPMVGASGYVPAIGHHLWIPDTLLPTVFVFLLFPDGHLISPRWRVVLWSAALGLAGIIFGLALHPGPVPSFDIEANPDGIPALAVGLDFVLQLARLLLWIGILGSIAAFVIRFRRSQGIGRQQMKWLGYAFGLFLLAIVWGTLTWSLWSDNPLLTDFSDGLTNLSVLGIAVATSIAILRYRLYDIDLLINRTLVYGALSAGVVIIYALVVGGTGVLFQSSGNLAVVLIATGLVAVLFNPLRQRLQRAVNRLLYGERDEPFSVLRRLGQRLESSGTPEDVLPAIVETVCQALKLPYAEITLRQGEGFERAARYGMEANEMTPFPIQYQGETIGYLNVAPRGPGELFNESDSGLLRQIALQAGPVARTVQLTRDLRQSRARLVTAREEERRRLRRDLHDGLGPVLASQGLKIAAVSHLLDSDPRRAQQLLDELASQNEATVSEIRRLVYALRPPELDELGLAGAIRDYAAGLNGSAVEATCFQANVQQLEMGLPGLPAAVEVAAYRIATEALTNVTRHARASHCTISITLEKKRIGKVLQLEIMDDGVGLSGDGKVGVGLNSMRERAEEVGGTFQIKSAPEKGTTVLARFPLGI
jgi:signal transduction histidine kinase